METLSDAAEARLAWCWTLYQLRIFSALRTWADDHGRGHEAGLAHPPRVHELLGPQGHALQGNHGACAARAALSLQCLAAAVPRRPSAAPSAA